MPQSYNDAYGTGIDAMLGAPLPNAAQAWVPREKMIGYLLAPEQKHGPDFIDLGYHSGNLEALERDLIGVAQTGPVVTVRPTEYGINYGVDGDILAPNGLRRRIRTAWIIPHGEDRPQFTSAYRLGVQ